MLLCRSASRSSLSQWCFWSTLAQRQHPSKQQQLQQHSPASSKLSGSKGVARLHRTCPTSPTSMHTISGVRVCLGTAALSAVSLQAQLHLHPGPCQLSSWYGSWSITQEFCLPRSALIFTLAASSKSAGGCLCVATQSSSVETSASPCKTDSSSCWPHALHSRQDQEQQQPLQQEQQQAVLLAERRHRLAGSSSASSSRWRQMLQQQTRVVTYLRRVRDCPAATAVTSQRFTW
jgi:hypothetical protein